MRTEVSGGYGGVGRTRRRRTHEGPLAVGGTPTVIGGTPIAGGTSLWLVERELRRDQHHLVVRFRNEERVEVDDRGQRLLVGAHHLARLRSFAYHSSLKLLSQRWRINIELGNKNSLEPRLPLADVPPLNLQPPILPE